MVSPDATTRTPLSASPPSPPNYSTNADVRTAAAWSPPALGEDASIWRRGSVQPWLGSAGPASSASSSTRPLLAHLAARRLFPRRSPRAPPWPSSRGGRSFVRSGRSFGLGRARRLPSSAPRTTRSTHDLAAASGPRGAPVRASVAPQPAATAAQPHRRRPRKREASTRAVRGRHPNFLVRLRATLAGVTPMCSDCACGPASAAVGAEQQSVDIDTFDGRRASA